MLRNLCYQILTGQDGGREWARVCQRIQSLFGVTLDEPTYIAERGEITMTCREMSGVRLALASSGRGLQQTLLLLVHYIQNQPQRAREHFHGLREAKVDRLGFALCDRLDRSLQPTPGRQEKMWRRREIENYLGQPETLLSYAESSREAAAAGPLFERSEAERRHRIMQECIDDLVPRAAMRDRSDPWWINTKVSNEFLDRPFVIFFERLGLLNLLRKTDYHILARYVAHDQIDLEVGEVLSNIVDVASRAKPIVEDS